MAYGNYDAGQSRPVSIPFFNGGVRQANNEQVGFNFDFGFKKADKTDEVPQGMGVERRTVSPEQRIAANTTQNANVLTSLAEKAEYDRQVDEMFAPYITQETKERMVGTSFNAAMALEDFDEIYNSLIV